MQFFHDGSNTYLLNNTGNLLIRNDGSSTSEEILIQPKGGENSIRAIANGIVELFHNDSKCLETTNTGVYTRGTGILTATTISSTNVVNSTQLSHRNKIINGITEIWQKGRRIKQL